MRARRPRSPLPADAGRQALDVHLELVGACEAAEEHEQLALFGLVEPGLAAMLHHIQNLASLTRSERAIIDVMQAGSSLRRKAKGNAPRRVFVPAAASQGTRPAPV